LHFSSLFYFVTLIYIIKAWQRLKITSDYRISEIKSRTQIFYCALLANAYLTEKI